MVGRPRSGGAEGERGNEQRGIYGQHQGIIPSDELTVCGAAEADKMTRMVRKFIAETRAAETT